MQRYARFILAAAAVALLASPALAQRRGGGMRMSPLFLLIQKPVQEDLKLTEDQAKKVQEATEKQREAFQQLRDLEQEERVKKLQELAKGSEKTVAGILTKDQVKRLKQITLQVRGGAALANPEIAKELNLTNDQKAQVAEIGDEARKELTKIREVASDPQEARQKSRDYRKTVNEKTMKILTADQKTKWKEMTGKRFKGELRLGPPPRRNNN